MSSKTSSQKLSEIKKQRSHNESQEHDKSEEETYKCECGRIALTEAQLKSHKKMCSEVAGDDSVLKSVSEDTCSEWRSMIFDGITSAQIEQEYNYSSNTIRIHLKGDCSHSDSDIEYDPSKRRWVHARHNKLEECVCGKKFLTSEQLKSHKANCDELCTETQTGSVIPEEVCSTWRRTLGEYESIPQMAKTIDYSVYALRRHIRGDCNHEQLSFYWEYTGRYWEARQK